ncbi:MAG: tRNA-dihydrouridine synthase, partial [Clostridia bacterium]|nr:tRNA-dihydrouridine synthase [Clostridia bacterium]
GNPYVFDEISCYLEGKPFTEVSNQTKKEDIKQHIRLLIEDKGEYVGVREARKHVAWYIKGLPGAASMRNRINGAESQKEMLSLIEEAFDAL